MKKRLVALAMAALLALGLPAAQSLAASAQDEETITIGTPTQSSGYFFSDMWGNNSVDVDIRSMLHGYATVSMNASGEYQLDETVVKELAIEDNADGGRTYTATLAQGLTYNDGSPITAADYVFSILLHSDAAIQKLGGTNVNYSHVTGHESYAAGESEVFSGVRLLSENRFSVTVPAEALPYFFEMAYVHVTPYPISVIAPGYAVRDDGQGAYLAMQTADGGYEPAALTPELLQGTLLGETGYAHRPQVTSGPYQLVEYNAADSSVTLEINPAYQGNYEGRKPQLARVRVIPLLDENAMEAFQNGSVQIVHRLTNGDAIDQAMDLSEAGEGEAIGYLRSGYSFIAFACEQAPMDDANVRKALAMCVDREAICENLMSGYALPVNGYYGWGQWMAAQSSEELTRYDDIGYNVNEARRLLEKAGYAYNQDGERYRVGRDTLRYKRGGGGTVIPLEIRWAKTQSTVTDSLEAMLTPIFEELGIKLQINPVTFAEMLEEYYRQSGETRTNNFFFLSTNFYQTFDPYHTYHTGDAWQGVFNTSGLRSEALMNAALELRSVAANDIEAYRLKWLEFQDAWHEEMPTAPIYSNLYYDLCSPELAEYQPSAHTGFAGAVLYASYASDMTGAGEAPEPETTAQGSGF